MFSGTRGRPSRSAPCCRSRETRPRTRAPHASPSPSGTTPRRTDTSRRTSCRACRPAGHVDEQILEEVRIGVAQEDEIVAGLALGLGGALGRQLQALDGVDFDRETGLLAEHLGLPSELVVGGRNEVVGAQERELALLGVGGSAIQQYRGAGHGRREKEVAARRSSHGSTPLAWTLGRKYHIMAGAEKGDAMPKKPLSLACVLFVAALMSGASAVSPALAQGKKLKIGVIYDYTGPLAGGGSDLHALGAKIMIDYFAKKGGVEGYAIEATYADAQSKPDVAINEAVRLVEQEKVDMLLGFYSSAQCVPVAAKVEQFKKFMWITTCISSAVLENRHLKYVFRAQPSGQQFGQMTMDFIQQNSKEKFGKDPKDLRIAIIHEDGAYGVDVAKGNEAGARKAGFQIVLKEGYSATAPDLSALVTKLKRARPDVIFHTGYNPDITLLLRQAREQGLKFQALVGHGAGYGVYEKLKEGLGGDANYLFNTDPISIWLANPKGLDPALLPVIKMVGVELDEVEPGVGSRPVS